MGFLITTEFKLEVVRRPSWVAWALLGLALVLPPVAVATPPIQVATQDAHGAADTEHSDGDSYAGRGSRSQLSQRLAGLQRFVAAFSQVVEGSRGEVVERSTGRLALDRPNFHWSVDAPYPQEIVAHNGALSIYDPDLAQVIKKPFDLALQDTPISLLTQEAVGLGDNFDVVFLAGTSVARDGGDVDGGDVDGGDVDGAGVDKAARTPDVFLLTPKSRESLYAEIRLYFDAHSLTQLGVLDHLGQYTVIRFSDVQQPKVIDSTEFQLDLPADVDVIEG